MGSDEVGELYLKFVQSWQSAAAESRQRKKLFIPSLSALFQMYFIFKSHWAPQKQTFPGERTLNYTTNCWDEAGQRSV